MLKQRLLTIVILLPVFVWCVLALPTRYFSMITAFVILLAAWEWAALVGLRAQAYRLAYLGAVLAAMLVCAWLITIPAMRQVILGGAVAWWLAALLVLRRYELDPRGFHRSQQSSNHEQFHPNWLFGMLGIVVLVPAWLAILIVHGSALFGSAFVLLLMGLIWSADSGAYIAGRLWGKIRLAPQVSPGKTWEGVYGGLLATLIVAVAAGQWFGFGWRTQVTLVLLGLSTALFSIIGDLFESMIKRMAGVKDSGHLLPGHGGVLDRIDSVTAAAPLFALGLLWQGVVS